MTTNLSNVFALDLTLNDVMFEAYDILQVATDGEPITGGLFNRARDSLNIMLKLWETQGIHLWTMTEGSLFLQQDLDKYDFNLEGRDTSAIHLANVFEQRATLTTLGGVVSIVLLQLDDVTDLAVGDQLGVLKDDNDLEWFLVMRIAADVVTLDHLASSRASVGSIVYTYDYLNSSTLASPNGGTNLLEVADTTIYNVGDTVLVLLDDDTTVSRIISDINQATDILTVTVALSGTASSGNSVLNDTTRRNQFKPVKRILNDNVRRRESTDYEIPIVFQSRKDYFDLPNKQQSGTPIQAYYDRQQPQGVMYLWNPPSSAQSIINFTYEREIMILTDPTHTFDLPVEWYDAVTYNLAKRLIAKVGCSIERRTLIVDGAKEYLDNALGFDQAVYPIRLKPQRYG